MLLVVVHRSPRGAAAALLVRVRVLEAGRLLHLGGLFLHRGRAVRQVEEETLREEESSHGSHLALGEAADEGAAGALVAAGIGLVRRVRSVLTLPLKTSTKCSDLSGWS